MASSEFNYTHTVYTHWLVFLPAQFVHEAECFPHVCMVEATHSPLSQVILTVKRGRMVRELASRKERDSDHFNMGKLIQCVFSLQCETQRRCRETSSQ